jgi:hypothetical protein
MADSFELSFQGAKFTVPKNSLFKFFEHHPELISTTSYDVQSSVPAEVFQGFVNALQTNKKAQVTSVNAAALALLAREFWLEELLSDCTSPSPLSASELITLLCERISKVEQQLVQVTSRLSACEQRLDDISEPITPRPTPLSPRAVSPSFSEVHCPLPEAKSLDGILSYLTRKHGGNFHKKGVVTITSKSLYSLHYAIRNLADLTTDRYFCSKDEPYQWVCWDFHEMRIKPTHYTIRSGALKLWVIESSLDGVHWTEIDRQVENVDVAEKPWVASFPVANASESRFIRLTQTDKNRDDHDILSLYAFEVFGTLLE